VVTVEQVVTQDAPPLDHLASQRGEQDQRFRKLERDVDDLIGRTPGSSRDHQLLQRETADIVGTFDELLASPLTQETVDLLGEVYAGLEAFRRRLEGRTA
jgi:hypothetical protein